MLKAIKIKQLKKLKVEFDPEDTDKNLGVLLKKAKADAEKAKADAKKSGEVKPPAPESTPELEKEDPKPEKVKENLGTLNGKKITKNEEKIVNSKVYRSITILDGSSYLLTDNDVEKQVQA